MDYSPIERAGLTQQEFAALINFSRPSTNLWINGRKRPGPKATRVISSALQALNKAVAEKHLPAEPGARREKLLRDINAWLQRLVQP